MSAKAIKRIESPLQQVTFRCYPCKLSFEAEPGNTVDYPEDPDHPWQYVHDCPDCGLQVNQVAWERNLLKAHIGATGPKTPEGRAASAKNIEGHPTPEETQITRFNAMKHGLDAKVATYMPARPGKYPQCDGCEYQEDETCKEYKGCLKQTEPFLKNYLAFMNEDPSLLREMHAGTQAGLHALLTNMLTTVAIDGGARLKSPSFVSDKDGGIHFVTFDGDQIYDHSDHPLLKHIINLVSKNNLSMSDLLMTPKSQEDDSALKGMLAQGEADHEMEREYKQTVIDGQKKLEALINGSYDTLDGNTVIDAESEVITGGR